MLFSSMFVFLQITVVPGKNVVIVLTLWHHRWRNQCTAVILTSWYVICSITAAQTKSCPLSYSITGSIDILSKFPSLQCQHARVYSSLCFFAVILRIIAPLQIVSVNPLNNTSRALLFSFVTAASVLLHSQLRQIESIHSITW